MDYACGLQLENFVYHVLIGTSAENDLMWTIFCQ